MIVLLNSYSLNYPFYQGINLRYKKAANTHSTINSLHIEGWTWNQVLCQYIILENQWQNNLKNIKNSQNPVYLGNQASRAFLVSSGVFVGFLTQPRRLLILCTCVSTPMPVILCQAACMQMCAIFGPTPGNAKRPSSVSGISPLCLSLQIWVACFM